jgi:Porin subfamily
MQYRLMLRGAAVAAAAALVVTLGDGANAQTLTDPSPQHAPSRPNAANPDIKAKVKSCGAYGAGFVNVPGTDACVKIGGSVTVGATTSRGR